MAFMELIILIGVVDDETKNNFLRQCTALTKAFALVSPHKEVNDIREWLENYKMWNLDEKNLAYPI